MAWTLSRRRARKVVLASPLLVLITSLAACTSGNSTAAPSLDEGDGGTRFDGGSGSGGGGDGAVALIDGATSSCSPANVQGYAPHWTPPRAHASSCTSAQIASYAACLSSNDASSAACAPWLSADAGANTTCRSCFADSNSTDATWGPIIDVDSIRQINVAGCLALAGGDNGGTGCAGQYQALQGCESAACATNCANHTSAQLDSCISEADTVGCSNYLSAAACVNDAGAADVCFGPQGGTFADLFAAVASVFCLSSGDGGAKATDAGDGG